MLESLSNKVEISTKVFSCKYCEIFKNTYFAEHLRTAASDDFSSVTIFRNFLILRIPSSMEHLRCLLLFLNCSLISGKLVFNFWAFNTQRLFIINKVGYIPKHGTPQSELKSIETSRNHPLFYKSAEISQKIFSRTLVACHQLGPV